MGSRGCCYRLPFVYIVRCVAVFDKSLLQIYLSKYEFLRIDDMSDNRESEPDIDPMVVESCGSSCDSPSPRARGRARPSLGHMRPPFPLLDPSQLSYPQEATGLSAVPQVGPSSTGSAWPRPQAIAAAVGGISSGTTMPAMGVSRPPVPSPSDEGPRPVLVDRSYGGNSSVSSDAAVSASSALGALANVALKDIPPPAGDPTPQMFDQPVLLPENLVMVARTAFGPGQAQILAPSILESFETQLTQADVTERLQLLWMMRREVASQVREIILLGRCAMSHQVPSCMSCWTSPSCTLGTPTNATCPCPRTYVLKVLVELYSTNALKTMVLSPAIAISHKP